MPFGVENSSLFGQTDGSCNTLKIKVKRFLVEQQTKQKEWTL